MTSYDRLPDFADIRQRANGMLRADVYRAIFEAVVATPDGDVVEVGAAHGAATIALALALRQKRALSRVVAFERAEGGSRQNYGGREENEAILRRNLEQFGVSDLVEVRIGSVGDSAKNLPSDLSALMLDADGRIDRDFRLFYNQVAPGGVIIIDDCEDRPKLKRLGGRRVRVDLKHVLTYTLVQHFIERGLLEEMRTIRGTFFGRKPEGQTSPASFDYDFAPQYGALVTNDGRLESRLRAFIRRRPRLERLLKRIVQRDG